MTAPASTAKDQGAEVLGTATDQAGAVASEAKSAATDVAGTAKEQAADVLSETVTQAKDLTAQVKQQATEQLGTQHEKITGSLKDLSSQLSSGDTSGIVGQVLSEAGSRLQSLADYVERVGPDGLVRDARSYARRNPGTFLLGAALAGLVSGRIMKGISAGSAAGSNGKTAQSFTPSTPVGTAAGDPLSGISEPGIGTSAGYVESPYPDSTYQPAPVGDPSLYAETRNGGSL
jgi:hypothetical protein